MAVSFHKVLKVLAPAIFIFNLASGVFGIAYVINPTYTTAWDVFGVILLVALFGNLLLVWVLDHAADKTSREGKRLNWASYGILAATMLAMLCMLMCNFLISITYANTAIGMPYALIFVSFFTLVAIGALLAGFAMKSIAISSERVQLIPESGGHDLRRGLRVLIIAISGFTLGGTAYLALLCVAGAPLGTAGLKGIAGVDNGIIGIGAAIFGGFWCYICLSATLFLVKVTRRYNRPKIIFAVGVVGLVASAILFAPIIVTPAATPSADVTFAEAFGVNWPERIPSSVENYFMPTRFVVPGYYLGIPPKDCIVIPNISFYNGTTGVDAGLTLFFDAFLPPNGGKDLPGTNSTLIRIHGGEWTIGDKGPGNMLQTEKYLAGQGYCVFDIQYGLNNGPTDSEIARSITPAHVMGNFSIDDMVRHIGIFCQYLAAHQAQYGANLSSVFISGGSAGGQLTCVTALAIASGQYASLFGSALVIRGYVP
ncbi:MAG TPA: hypothetical protein VKK79_01245, partial [Candidatus Lokiarchaeia archaeon]|nr:hypothetical protein [Candidatus Lokiarchaeia archaeon]